MSTSFTASFTPPPSSCSSSCCLTLGQLLQQAACVGSSLAAGGALFTSLVICPVRMALPAGEALKNYQLLFKPSAWFVGGLSTASSLCAATAYLLMDRQKPESLAVAGCAVCMAVPLLWTVAVMWGTNSELLMEEEGGPKSRSDGKVMELLGKWNCLHSIRSIFALAGLLCAVRGLTAVRANQ
eukprot:GHVS01008557.1.p2 GENE.GHVS01008557.1~~GHVS01008557.1.p2  ORF type:complete len:183 (-),score=62.14 GHVS01008557.1:487-1035(-)